MESSTYVTPQTIHSRSIAGTIEHYNICDVTTSVFSSPYIAHVPESANDRSAKHFTGRPR